MYKLLSRNIIEKVLTPILCNSQSVLLSIFLLISAWYICSRVELFSFAT